MRIVHISDLHFWHITLHPRELVSKRLLGMCNLVLSRARKYRMSSMPLVVERIRALEPDHVLVTGDLTSTALEEEFEAARRALERLEPDASRLTVIPGNHDRYTRESARRRLFEAYFGEFAPARDYPWVKPCGEETLILALDPTHPNPISALGTISTSQLERAAALLDCRRRPERLLVACHYPIALPVGIVETRGHGLRGIKDLQRFVSRYGPNIYCHGHIHASWAFTPQFLPETLCLNPGAALKLRRRSRVSASLLEIVLEGADVAVRHHRLRDSVWEAETLASAPGFFGSPEEVRFGTL
ncbi:MAG: metallophosphoesterase [Acidobacteria bacterium]|nr:MAG: metallophosphoesterase [Acidobacteriota bacterium]